MALLNYSLPFSAPAPPSPYLGGLPGYNTAPAVNSLFYGQNPPQPQHLGGRQSYPLTPPPPAPSRKSATTPRRPAVNNDPYRGQQPNLPDVNRQQNYFNNNNGNNFRNVAPPPLPSSVPKQQTYPSKQQSYLPNPPPKQPQPYLPNSPTKPQPYPSSSNQQPYLSNSPGNQQPYPPNNPANQQPYPSNTPANQQSYSQNNPSIQIPYPSNIPANPLAYPSNPPKKEQPYPSTNTPTKQESFPSKPSGYEKIDDYVSPSAKTSLHAVLDYDDDFDDYSYDDEDVAELPPEYRHTPLPAVTPIQGPIFIKNNSVPVVPLYAHSVVNNGSLVQIPILWTALSVALGLEIRGEIIRGVPCIKRFHQLFCPTAGNSYPIDRIEGFIDDNKALMKRMYGEFQMSTEYGPPSRESYGDPSKRNVKREAPDDAAGGRRRGRKSPAAGAPDTYQSQPPAPDPVVDTGSGQESYFSKLRQTRQSFRNNQSSESGRVDACESKIEITTPYWASNSAGKIRAIVNTQHFEQAIHQEVCSSKMQTKRCSGDCGCEQKYKWHRLLAYDPDNDCKGIFMDWFLFPSCCVCRCNPLFGGN